MYAEGRENQCLHAMRAGLGAFRLGRYDLAQRWFDEAILDVEALEAGARQADRAKSKFVREQEKWFKGESYERSALFFYAPGATSVGPEAVDQLRISIYGGRTEDNREIAGIPLDPNDRFSIEFHYTYALALSRENQCGEALQIVQALQSKVRSNEDAMAAADKAIEICQENLDNPAVDTPTPTPGGAPTAEGTATPLPN